MPARRRRTPPLWQWVAALGGACVFVVALIVFVDRETAASNQPAGPSPSALAEQNREARIVVSQDQAPHVVALRGGRAGGAARAGDGIRAAVAGYMRVQIRNGSIPGPLSGVRCAAVPGRAEAGAGAGAGRIAFHCTAVAASVNYPFLGVADWRARRITYCKRDLPPVPGMNVPVSHRCV